MKNYLRFFFVGEVALLSSPKVVLLSSPKVAVAEC
jgi:hypothetical protein